MKKKIIIILLIFSLFISISSISATDMSDASSSNDLESFNDIDGLIDNENFNADNGEILENYLDSSNNETDYDLNLFDSNINQNNYVEESIINSNESNDIDDVITLNNENKNINVNIDDFSLKNNILYKNNLKSGNAIYVSPSGTGSGNSIADPTNWTVAYTMASDDDIIYFLDGTYTNIINFYIRKNLNLIAVNVGSAIIDGGGSRILYTTSNNLTINGLTFINGKTNMGGAIYSSSGNLVLINATFINNTATSQGGAAYAKDGNLTVIDSKFINNSASSNGGAIYSYKYIDVVNSSFENNKGSMGAGVYSVNGTITDSNFTNNTGSSGGAVYGKNLTVSNSVFEFNNGSYQGGAICCDNLDISNSSFINNTAKSNGGAVSSSSGNLSIKDCEFINNTAEANGGAVYSYRTLDVENSNFENNSGKLGGAVYSVNARINDSNFTNNSGTTGGAVYNKDILNVYNSFFELNNASGQGGAICSDVNIVDNSYFINNSADGAGGALRAYKNNTISNSQFVNNTSILAAGGGAYGTNNTITNSLFLDNTALNNGGAVHSNDNTLVDHSQFVNNSALNLEGGAINTKNGIIYESSFVNNSANRSGGAIVSTEKLDVNASEFIGNVAFGGIQPEGGAIRSQSEVNINNSYFENNNASFGGALHIRDLTIENSEFLNNNANYKENNSGGAIYVNNIYSVNNEFKDNGAYIGGAIYSLDESYLYYNVFDGNKANSTAGAVCAEYLNSANNQFLNNYATNYGGGAYASYISSNNDLFINNTGECAGGGLYIGQDARINNGSFISNNATNGGGIFAYANSTVNNSKFINNTAFDGAGIISETLDLNNSYFENNIALSYGVIYAANATIENNNFTANEALDNKIIYVLSNLNEENNSLDPSDILSLNKDPIPVIEADNRTYFFKLENGIEGYCLQKTLYMPEEVYLTDNLTLARNQLTGEDVSEYLKILIYKYYPEYKDSLARIMWDFTDGDYLNSENNITKAVVELYNSGFRVPTYNASLISPNSTQVIINFYTAADASSQNLFLFNYTYLGKDYNLKVEKITLNQSVLVGEQVEFIIRASNMGDTILHDVSVWERSYDGLIYDGFKDDENKWTYDGNRWVLNNPLLIGESAEFIVVFNSTMSGYFTNVVVASSNETDNKTTNNTTEVLTPNMTVEKISLDPVVINGEQSKFLIRVTNNGETVLNNVSVTEESYDGLIYDRYIDENNIWTNENNRWILNNPLGIDETAELIVVFNSTMSGNFTNVVVASSNETENKTTNNTTEVFTPDMAIEKITLNQTVINGEQVQFLIKVTNTGETVLNNVKVTESSYEGLVYDSYIDSENIWTYDNGGNWILNNPLYIGQSAELIVVFNSTMSGNFTNVVVASSNETDNKTTNNTTEVLTPNMTVEKISLDPVVINGEQSKFIIRVTNNGETVLNDVTVTETSYEGLIYDSYIDSDSIWTYENNKWTLNNPLNIGESADFTVVFNSTMSGNFTNVVVASSNETDNKTTNNTTEVLTPNMAVEKISLDPVVINGEQSKFLIRVTNNGETVLNDVTVTEISYEGLIYDSYIDSDSIWTYENNKWTLNNPLDIGQSAELIVVFNSTMSGNFTNVVVASSNETDNKTTNNTTEVLTPNMAVEKISLDPVVINGEQSKFIIRVTNNGETVLNDVTVTEISYEGLIYDSYIDSDSIWTYENNKWTLNNPLDIGQSAELIVVFNSTMSGNFTNVVVASSNETDNKTTNNTTEVLTPSMTVEKITLNQTVINGQQVQFLIKVTNTGETVLNNVSVVESSYEGLVYDSYIDSDSIWTYENNKWTLNNQLNIGESADFTVVFNSTMSGNFTNVIVASSNETDNKTTNNTTTVFTPKLEINKISLNETVKVGEIVQFKIVLRNAGDCNLTGVYIRDNEYSNGLKYLSYVDENNEWNFDGKDTWTYRYGLSPGESISLDLIFQGLTEGIKINNAFAGENITNDTVNSSNKTKVIKEIPPEDDSNKTVEPNRTDDDKKIIKKHPADYAMPKAGNPLMVLLLSLIALIMVPLRNKK